MIPALPNAGPFAGHSPQQESPLGSYAALTGTFAALTGTFAALTAAFAGWLRRSGRQVPARIDAGDSLLVAVATHKSSRLVAKDRVTSGVRAPFTRFAGDAGPGEVEESARGHGLRRAIGELLVCPYSIGPVAQRGVTAGTAPDALDGVGVQRAVRLRRAADRLRQGRGIV
jgi:hypothetical protein